MGAHYSFIPNGPWHPPTLGRRKQDSQQNSLGYTALSEAMRGNCCLIAVLPLLLSRSGQSLAPRGLSSLAAPSSLSLLSWNINGFRSLLKHDASLAIMRGLIESKQPDFIWYTTSGSFPLRIRQLHACNNTPYHITSYHLAIQSLQETKLQEMHTESIEAQLRDLGLCEHMKVWWNSSRARKGYSGR